jgi:hypothetical protein
MSGNEDTIRTPYGRMPLSDDAYEQTFSEAESAFIQLQKSCGTASCRGVDYVSHSRVLWGSMMKIMAHQAVTIEMARQSLKKAQEEDGIRLRLGPARPAFTGEFGDGGDQ